MRVAWILGGVAGVARKWGRAAGRGATPEGSGPAALSPCLRHPPAVIRSSRAEILVEGVGERRG